jgi:hypothetical protein
MQFSRPSKWSAFRLSTIYPSTVRPKCIFDALATRHAPGSELGIIWEKRSARSVVGQDQRGYPSSFGRRNQFSKFLVS